MNGFQMYLNSIDDPNKRERMKSILSYIKKTFPQLKEEIWYRFFSGRRNNVIIT
jgi:uncharacterized protein YdhG (YjbR/CyaY superfamily)